MNCGYCLIEPCFESADNLIGKKKSVSDGGDLLSHTVAHAVPSAQASLTAVFGMGTGVASLL